MAPRHARVPSTSAGRDALRRRDRRLRPAPGPDRHARDQVEDEAAALAETVEALVGLAPSRADRLRRLRRAPRRLELAGGARRAPRRRPAASTRTTASRRRPTRPACPDETTGFGYVDLQAARAALPRPRSPAGAESAELDAYLEPLGGLVFWGEDSATRSASRSSLASTSLAWIAFRLMARASSSSRRSRSPRGTRTRSPTRSRTRSSTRSSPTTRTGASPARRSSPPASSSSPARSRPRPTSTSRASSAQAAGDRLRPRQVRLRRRHVRRHRRHRRPVAGHRAGRRHLLRGAARTTTTRSTGSAPATRG